MLFGPKQRVHSDRIPDHGDWPKIKKFLEYVQTKWALPCYWERPPQAYLALERRQAMCTLPTKWGGNWAALPNLLPNVKSNQMVFVTCAKYNSEMLTYKSLTNNAVMYDHIRDTYFPKTHKEFNNNSNSDKHPYLSFKIPQNVQSQQQNMCPVAMRKGQPEEHKQHCKYHQYLSVYLSPSFPNSDFGCPHRRTLFGSR